MIAEVRDYFNKRILECFPNYVDCKDPFGDNDLATVNLDKQYRVIIGNVSTQDLGNNLIDTLSVRIDIFKKGYNKEQESFDAIYDGLISLRENILNPRAWNDNDYIKHITPMDLVVTPIADSNDNNMQSSASFEVLVTSAITTKDV